MERLQNSIALINKTRNYEISTEGYGKRKKRTN